MDKLSERIRSLAKAWRELSDSLFNKINAGALDEIAEEVVQLEAIKEVCEWLFEREEDGYTLKYIKVEGEGDTWHIPEAIGLALSEVLKVGEKSE